MPSLSRSILDSALNVNDRNRDLSLARDVEEQAAPLRQALSFNVPDLGTLLGSNAPASVQQPAAPAPAQPSGPFGFAPVSFALPDIDTLIGRPKPQPAAIQQPAQMPQAEGTRVPATPSGSPAAMPTGAGAPTGAAPTTHFDGTPLSPEAADLARRAYAAAVKAGHPDPAEFVEQMALESMQWNPEVVAGRRASPSGAQGVAQLMPEVAAQAGVNPHDVDAALAYAAGRMARNYRTYGGDRERALAEYHMGAGNLERHGPRGLEDTAAYIDAITGRARGRGQPAPTTPPATPSGTPQPMPQASAASHYEGDGHDHGAAYDVAFGFNQEYGSAQFNQSIPRHRGVDLVVRGAKDGGRGSPVPAFRGGTVVAVTSEPNGGNGIILQDEQGLYHRYFHFDSINVKQGDRIAPGQHIGILGASGTEGFPHVHFEVSQGINGDPMDQLIDPRPYMRPAGRQGAAQPAAQPAPVAQQQAPLPMASGDETMMMRTGDDLPASQVSAGDQKRARLMAAQGQTADDEVQYRAPLDQPMDDPGGAPALAPASPATAAVNPDEYDPAWLQGPPAISPITGEPTGLAPLPGQAQTRPQADLSVTGEVQAGASYGPTAYDTPPATYAPPLTHQAADPARWEQAEESTPPWVREPYGPPMPAMPDTRRVEYPHLLPESRFPQLAGAAGVAPAPEVRIPRAEYAEAREAGVPIAYAPQGPVQGPPAPAPSAAERIAGGTYGREVAGKATGDGLTPFDILSLPDDARDALIDLVYDASPATVAAARAAGSRLTGQATGGFADMVESLVNPHKREGARAALGITLGLPLALGADRIRKAGGAAGRIVGELLDPGGKVAEAGLRAAGRGAKDAWRNSGAVAGIGAAGAAGAGMAMGEVDDPADVLEAGAAGAGTALAARYGTAPALRAAGRGARAAGEAWQQGRQVARELNAADRQGAPAYAALGAVPEGESRRFYHGTAGAFERPDPGKFDPNGLFGPGYYLTSDPRVASSYADAAQGPTKERLERLQRDRDELVPYIESYRSGPLRRAFGPADADRRLAEVIDEIRAIDREMAELVPSGPNVRAIDVPSGLRLLDPEAVMKPAEVRRIARRLAQATGSRYFADLSQTSNADMGYLSRSYSGMMTEWRNTEPGASWARGNQALAAAGYDGLQHTGGKRVPMMDDAGKPIEHDVTIIFPESLGRIRNALSGEVGGATFGTLPEAGTTGGTGRLGTANRALGQGLASAASGSIAGTYNAQANPDDPDAFATGFVAGAVGPAAISRGARAAARRAGAATDGGGAVARASFGGVADAPARQADEAAPPFYSQLRRVIDEKMPNRAAPQQVMGIVKGGSVKPDEIAWTGFDDWIREQRGPIAKQQVLDFLDQHAVRVEEVVKSDDVLTWRPGPGGALVAAEAPTLRVVPEPDGRYRLEHDGKPSRVTFATADEAKRAALDIANDPRVGVPGSPTRYGDYTTPGGQNYRELLLTLPTRQPDGSAYAVIPSEREYGRWAVVNRATGENVGLDYSSEEAARRALESIAQRQAENGAYRSSHWDEPNVLAHVRFSERTAPDGTRTLLVDEVQSDWHQAGRKQGYQGDPAADSGAVPDAPFKKTWPELAIKRMIRWAAENGFDRIAWPPGAVHAKRYDLSRQISRITYQDAGWAGGTPTFHAYDKRGRGVLSRTATEDELPGLIGQELTERLLAAPKSKVEVWGPKGRALEGVDIRVGGEGMVGFYDQILPNVAAKLGKKFGARVTQTPLARGKPRVWSMDVTPRMRDSVLKEGQPLFAGMPIDPASAAAGGLAGAASGEDEEPDPLRAGAGMLAAGMLGRKRLSKAERGALELAAKAADARPRPAGLGNVPPSAMREPTLPGMEAPYVRPNLPDISEEASGPRSLSDVLASPERQAGIPGLESPTPAARPVGAVADDLALTPEQRTARASEAVQQFPGAQSWVARAAERNRREIARRDQEPLSPVRWLMRLAGNVGYGSMLGPGTAAFNTFIGIGEPIWSMPKEAVRGVVRAARAGNLSALREQGEMQWGALYGMSRMGEAVIDVLRGRGAYAPNPNFPTLSEQTVNPVAKLVAQATEVPGRVWSGLPDAIFGTIAQHAGEARAAAQAATNKGLTGKAWSDEVGRLLEDARAVGRGELPTSPDVQQVVDAGAAYAKRQTYRDELGKVGKAAEGAAKLGNTPLLGNWASPFFTSIWNAGLRQAEKSPFGLGMNTAPTRIDKYYDAIVGGAVILALAQYARSGGVTGSGPADPRERELLQAEGWQPYSTLTPGPDGQWYYVPNRGYALFEGPLNAAGEIHDYFAYGKPDADARAKFDDAARRLGQVIRQNPYAASGIVSILDAYNHGPAAEVADNLARMTPLAATARTLGMAGDDKERTTDRGKGVPIEDEIFQRWQLATGQRSGLPAAQDAFGQERENRRPGGWAFAPSMTRKGDDPVARVFREARVLPGDPKSELRVSQSQAIPPVPLKPAERRLWDQKRGEVLRDAGQFIAAEPEWKDAPLEVKQRVLRQVMDAAGKTADGAVLASLGEEEVARRIEAALRKKAS